MGGRTVLRGLGKTCIAAGLLILLFVAYELWGTGIAEAHSQRRLKAEFAASAPTPAATPPASTTALPAAPVGAAIAIIDIPKIGVDAAVVQGVGVADLEEGPGHYPDSPLPGQAGNAAIAGHRTTYGAPFYRLNELSPGDVIYVTTQDSPTPWKYVVMSETSVSPDDVSVLDPTPDNRLTLTTCTPRFTAEKRLVVVSQLVGAVDPHPPAAPAAPTATTPGSAPATSLAGADVGSLSGQGTTIRPAIEWGVVCAALWALAALVARRWRGWRRWLAYLVASPAFLLALYFFFENFGGFVPANI